MHLKFLFGTDATSVKVEDNVLIVNLKSKVLNTRNHWKIIDNIEILDQGATKYYFGNDQVFGGIFFTEVSETLDKDIYNVYEEILTKSTGWNLCRAWNFIPKINECIQDDLIYVMYNRGRSDAFYAYASDPTSLMPAATGIDILGEKAVTIFLASREEAHHFANPLQTDSFQYPKKYGKRPPSFSRGTRTKIDGKTVVFVSGTASIRGSRSVHIGDMFKQIDTTIENIEEVIRQTCISREVLNPEAFFTEKVIYIKDERLASEVKKYMLEKYPAFGDGIFILANVCRDDLDFEMSFTAYEK